PFAAGREEIGEQGLQDGEALRNDGASGPLARCFGARHWRGSRKLRRCLLVPVANHAQSLRDLAPELIGLEGDRPPVLPEDPRGELRQRGVASDEDAVLQLPGVSEGALDPPCRISREFDARLALEVPDLPRGPAAVLVDVEVSRDPEVALTPGCEPDVPPDARD